MSERHLARVLRVPSSHSKRLGGGEAAVIVTVLTLAGTMVLAGIPAAEALSLLSCAGLIAVLLVTAARAHPLRSINRALRALLALHTQR